MTTNSLLDFDIVLPTRNRQSVLPLSIPLMLAQSRKPKRFIVVDASDNHDEVRRIVERLFEQSNSGVDLQILRAEAGSSYQRNVGLREVKSPVVFLPDDDSLWFPGTTDAIMRIYERDVEGAIGCVVPGVSGVHPPGVFGAGEAPYRLELRDRVAAQLRKFVGPVEQHLFPDPIYPGGLWWRAWSNNSPPVWLQEEDAELCGPVIGYRMSFRAELICKLGGFDEGLGRYSMFEDSDASMGILKGHMIVCAHRARVFHYRVPGKRVSGAEFGMMAILNRTYVVCKHLPPGSIGRRWLRRYLYYKMVRYFMQTYSQYGRERLAGAYFGLSKAHQLMNAPQEELSDRFVKIRKQFAER